VKNKNYEEQRNSEIIGCLSAVGLTIKAVVLGQHARDNGRNVRLKISR
jgi:hypothetical protein